MSISHGQCLPVYFGNQLSIINVEKSSLPPSARSSLMRSSSTTGSAKCSSTSQATATSNLPSSAGMSAVVPLMTGASLTLEETSTAQAEGSTPVMSMPS